MYLPWGPCRNSCSDALYDFIVSTTNSIINPTTILSSQKSTTQVNLLFTCCNYSICTGVQSSCRICFVAWLSFNPSIHSCNKCGKSQKKTSCKSVNTYFSRYLWGVTLGFLLSFYAKSSSFFLNQLSISAFVGFHGLNIPFWWLFAHFPNIFLIYFRRVFNSSHLIIPHLFLPTATEPFVGYSYLSLYVV
jgi:hypothetical protein